MIGNEGVDTPKKIRVEDCPSWHVLQSKSKTIKEIPLRTLLQDTVRNQKLRHEYQGLYVDFSRQHVDSSILEELLRLVTERDLKQSIDQMFTGERINSTEKRAVLHTALRAKEGETIAIEGKNVVPDVIEVRKQMAEFSGAVRNGTWRGVTGEKITTIVSIGIGGSNLGPEMAYHALKQFRTPGIEVHFIANVDPEDLDRTLQIIDPAKTLFIIASKTFTTNETMANAHTARDWLTKKLGNTAISRHFVAVSANKEKVEEFGIDSTNMFVFWDWVGGRFSVSSAIGLPVMIAIGSDHFKDFLSGMHEMDMHYRSTPFEKNIPVLMALLNIWNTNFLGYDTHGVIAYSELLELFPFHLQQLIMESLGKGVGTDGKKTELITCPIFYPGLGTNAQHAFFQLLHQGNVISPLDIIVPVEPTRPELQKQQTLLVLNAVAQSKIMADGITEEELRKEGVSDDLIPHKLLPGDRPTTFICMKQVSPHALGMLLAMYEHMVHAWGSLIGINAFDQYGVEGGKNIARGLEKQVSERLTVDEVKRLLSGE